MSLQAQFDFICFQLSDERRNSNLDAWDANGWSDPLIGCLAGFRDLPFPSRKKYDVVRWSSVDEVKRCAEKLQSVGEETYLHPWPVSAFHEVYHWKDITSPSTRQWIGSMIRTLKGFYVEAATQEQVVICTRR